MGRMGFNQRSDDNTYCFFLAAAAAVKPKPPPHVPLTLLVVEDDTSFRIHNVASPNKIDLHFGQISFFSSFFKVLWR